MNVTLGNLLAILAALSTALGPIQDALIKVYETGSLFFAALVTAYTLIVAQVAPFFKGKDKK